YDDPLRMPGLDCPRFLPREREGYLIDRRSIAPAPVLDRRLVDLRLVDDHGQSCPFQDHLPRCAAGSQHDRLQRPAALVFVSAQPGVASGETALRRARILMISAAVSSIERRVTSITGQPIFV